MNREDAYIAARELQLLSGGRLDVVFHGTSMRPLLIDGDEVLVESVEPTDVRIGDLLVYRDADRFPTRRLVDLDHSALTLWCDNWPDRRYRVPHERLVGRAVARTRDGHRIDARSPEWSERRRAALRAYRRARPRLEVRRIRAGVMRRMRQLRESR